MPLVTERPRAPLDKSKDPNAGTYTYRSTRVFDVTPTTGDTVPLPYATALAAVVTAGINFDSSYNTDFPDAVVIGIGNEYNAVAGMWTFTATYGDGPGSGFLSKPPKIKYEPYIYSELVDHDVDNVPYQDSAGNPFDPPMEIEKIGVVITVRVPKASYSFSTLYPYASAINSTALVLPDSNSLPAKSTKFLMPSMAFKDSSVTNIWLDLKFDWRPGVAPWNKNLVDQAAEGWGEDDAGKKIKGLFVTNAAGASPAGTIRLDGTGVPIDPTTFSQVVDPSEVRYDIAGPPGTTNPVAGVVSPPVGSGGLSTYTGSGTTGIVVLSFKRNKEMDLNSLLT